MTMWPTASAPPRGRVRSRGRYGSESAPQNQADSGDNRFPMRCHISRNVQAVAGGERARHFAARPASGMLKLDSGTPSFPTPPHIREAAKKALDEGLTDYAPGQGDPEFLAAVCETVEREAGARYSPDDVFATNGSTSGIYAVFTAFLDPGDEAILLDPTFSLYAH